MRVTLRGREMMRVTLRCRGDEEGNIEMQRICDY